MALDKKHIHYFSQKVSVAKAADRDSFGIRARLALDLAEMALPVLPGLVFDGTIADEISDITGKI